MQSCITVSLKRHNCELLIIKNKSRKSSILGITLDKDLAVYCTFELIKESKGTVLITVPLDSFLMLRIGLLFYLCNTTCSRVTRLINVLEISFIGSQYT